jgi:hypothetical protein
MLVASLAANVFTLLSCFTNRATVKANGPLAAGAPAPPLEVMTLDGRPQVVPIPADKKGMIVYAFSPHCQWCERNTVNVRALATSTRGNFAFVGLAVSGDELPAYVASHQLPFPVYVARSTETIEAFRLRSTPTTYLLSSSGLIVRSWQGAFGGPTARDLERTFGVTLPGLGR